MAVTINLYDFLGREVKSLIIEKVEEAGMHQVDISGLDVPAGIYYFRLKAGGRRETRKIVKINDF